MSNNGHGATAFGWLMLILVTVLKGLLLFTLALENKVISKLIDHSLFEVLFKYFFFASETLMAIGTLAAIFRLLFVKDRTNSSRRFPSHLPWWCGR